MIISIINHSNGKISDEEIQGVIRAINRQIREDFEPYWSLGATLRLEGRSEKKPSKEALADMRGDAIIYLWSEVDVDDAFARSARTDRRSRSQPSRAGTASDKTETRRLSLV